MEVPTHSTEDTKATLSKKGALPRKSVRNVMQSPYSVFWPMAKDVTLITDILKKLLVPFRRKAVRILWSDIKDMTTEDRRRARRAAKVEMDQISLRQELHYGMNALMYGIENHNVASAVLCEDLQPKFMLNNILDLAAIHCVPIIILPELRELTRNALGFSCSSLGVKKIVAQDENSYFNPLHKTIVDLAKEHQLSENTAMYHCPEEEVTDSGGHLPASTSQEPLKRHYKRESDSRNGSQSRSSQSYSRSYGRNESTDLTHQSKNLMKSCYLSPKPKWVSIEDGSDVCNHSHIFRPVHLINSKKINWRNGSQVPCSTDQQPLIKSKNTHYLGKLLSFPESNWQCKNNKKMNLDNKSVVEDVIDAIQEHNVDFRGELLFPSPKWLNGDKNTKIVNLEKHKIEKMLFEEVVISDSAMNYEIADNSPQMEALDKDYFDINDKESFLLQSCESKRNGHKLMSQQSFKKECRGKRSAHHKQSSVRTVHPYLRSFENKSSRLDELFGDEKWMCVDQGRMSENAYAWLGTKKQGNGNARNNNREFEGQGNCNQSNNEFYGTKNKSCNPIPLSKHDGKKEKRVSFHPYKSVRIIEIAGLRKPLRKIKSCKN